MLKSPIPPDEILVLRKRATLFTSLVALAFVILASRLWYLQILKGEMYADFSQGNRIRIIPQAAPRGVIYDRNGIPIADNRPAYQLELVREDTPDLKQTLKNLSLVLNKSEAELQQLVDSNRQQAPFKPILLEDDLAPQTAALIQTYQADLPGITITATARRYYPYDLKFSHLLGYVGRITDVQQQKQLPENKKRSGEVYGRSSIEKAKNDTLVGVDGGRQVEVDHLGRELRSLSKPIHPIPGDALHLSIDAKLQQKIADTMEGKTGAVIVMNPKTGEVLSLASFPGFDPNLFVSGISYADWQHLLNMPGKPLNNKALLGQYPPGSIFKLVTAYAGLAEGVVTPESTHTCNGFYQIQGRGKRFKCWNWKLGGHGVVDLNKAIAESCNIYFYHIGQTIGVDKLHQYATRFGFGSATQIPFIPEKTGLTPNQQWKQQVIGEPWYPGETLPVAIGQGYTLVTPMQVAQFINIIANRGDFHLPHFEPQKGPFAKAHHLDLVSEYIELIRQGMISAVNDDSGTARVARQEEWVVAAKTGTVQVVGHQTLDTLEEKEKSRRNVQNHAWFAAFAPAEDPEISITVLVEHGVAGSSGAGPIAKAILDYYLQHRPSHFSQQLHSAFE